MCSDLWIAVLAVGTIGAQGKEILRIEQAAKLAFPGAKVERKTVYLTKDQRKSIGKLAGEKFARGIVFPYVTTKQGKLVGTAYVDAHRVRTKFEALMIVVTPAGKVGRVEVLAFREPTSYLPPKAWYRHLDGRQLDKNLRVRSAIKGVTGATLTAKATAKALRRTLALHRVLNPSLQKAPKKPAPPVKNRLGDKKSPPPGPKTTPPKPRK